MKSLRSIALMLAVSAFPIFSMQAFAQQEVNPDHYDEPIAQASAYGAKAQNQHKAAYKQHHSNVKLASKHSAGKGNHHHTHAA